jgi:RNA polymerase sigma factor (sigma-70 family)
MTPLEPHPEDTLLDMLMRGDERAIVFLYNHYYQALFTMAKAQLHSPEEADEIVQKLFITIWYRRTRLNMKRPLLRYLLKSVQNRIRNALRDTYHQRVNVFSLEDHHRHEQVLLAEAADSQIHVKEIQQCVSNAKQKMKPHVRKIFELRVEQGKSQAEIAGELNVSVKAVEKSLAIARKIARVIFVMQGWQSCDTLKQI